MRQFSQNTSCLKVKMQSKKIPVFEGRNSTTSTLSPGHARTQDLTRLPHPTHYSQQHFRTL